MKGSLTISVRCSRIRGNACTVDAFADGKSCSKSRDSYGMSQLSIVKRSSYHTSSCITSEPPAINTIATKKKSSERVSINPSRSTDQIPQHSPQAPMRPSCSPSWAFLSATRAVLLLLLRRSCRLGVRLLQQTPHAEVLMGMLGVDMVVVLAALAAAPRVAAVVGSHWLPAHANAVAGAVECDVGWHVLCREEKVRGMMTSAFCGVTE